MAARVLATAAVAGAPEVEYVVACRTAFVGLRLCSSVKGRAVLREAEATRSQVRDEARSVGPPSAVVSKLTEALLEGLLQTGKGAE